LDTHLPNMFNPLNKDLLDRPVNFSLKISINYLQLSDWHILTINAMKIRVRC